jgi:hypothetical protein
MPVVVRTSKKALVPDVAKWSRLHAAGIKFERAEDVPRTAGTSVFFICGRGQTAVDAREDCGYYSMSFVLFQGHALTITSGHIFFVL